MTTAAFRPSSYDKRPSETVDYVADCPAATWRGRLDFRVWGKSANLFLYFTDLDTGQKWRLSVWHRDGYKPRKEGPDFNEGVAEGDTFEIVTSRGRTGWPCLVSAALLNL
jgi:hypothetical protein